MAATFTIEEEKGTYVGSPCHPHNGYYAGDFSGRPFPGGASRQSQGAPHS